jgi:hypothetical protein
MPSKTGRNASAVLHDLVASIIIGSSPNLFKEEGMKTMFKSMMAALAATVILGAGIACAAEEAKPAAEAPKVTGSASVGVFNRYIFRGYELSSGSAVIQPQLSVSYYGFTATVWGNIDTHQKPTQSFVPAGAEGEGHRSWNETDLTLSYTFNPIDKLSLTAGFIYYGTKYVKETDELFLSATYDIITKPTLAIYRDIRSYPGTYINLSFSHSLPVFQISGNDATVDLGASFGYMIGSDDYWNTYTVEGGVQSGKKYSAFHDGMVKAGLTLPVTKSFSVQPNIQYWFPLSSKAKRIVDGVSYNPNGHLDNNIVAGVGFTLTF